MAFVIVAVVGTVFVTQNPCIPQKIF